MGEGARVRGESATSVLTSSPGDSKDHSGLGSTALGPAIQGGHSTPISDPPSCPKPTHFFFLLGRMVRFRVVIFLSFGLLNFVCVPLGSLPFSQQNTGARYEAMELTKEAAAPNPMECPAVIM